MRAHALLVALWLAGVKSLPEATTPLLLFTAATFKGSRVIVHELIGRKLRAPLLEHDDGLRGALNDLTSCTRCTGLWVALGLQAAEAVSPRFGRALVRTLALGTANDFTQALFAQITRR